MGNFDPTLIQHWQLAQANVLVKVEHGFVYLINCGPQTSCQRLSFPWQPIGYYVDIGLFKFCKGFIRHKSEMIASLRYYFKGAHALHDI